MPDAVAVAASSRTVSRNAACASARGGYTASHSTAADTTAGAFDIIPCNLRDSTSCFACRAAGRCDCIDGSALHGSRKTRCERTIVARFDIARMTVLTRLSTEGYLYPFGLHSEQDLSRYENYRCVSEGTQREWRDEWRCV